MQEILITGGSGFIGYHFHRFIDQARIVNFDLVPPTFPARSIYVSGDIRESASLEAALAGRSCEAIICLAAEHKDFGIEREAYFKTNEYGTRVICDAATQHGVKKIVFFSSVAVYGNTSAPTTEETPVTPASPYGDSKAAGEEVLRSWAREDGERSVVIMRPTVVIGIRNRANMLHLITQIDRNRYANIGEAANVKSVAYVDNLVQATLFLIDRMQPGVVVFNYADEPQLTVRKITKIIAAGLGKSAPLTIPYSLARILAVPFDIAIRLTGRDIPVSSMRIKKICTATQHNSDKLFRAGFKPEFSTVEGLQRMVAWYLGRKLVGDTPRVGTEQGG